MDDTWLTMTRIHFDNLSGPSGSWLHMQERMIAVDELLYAQSRLPNVRT